MSVSSEGCNDAFADLDIDPTCAERANGDAGLAFDIRLLTRRSAPPLWRQARNDGEQPPPPPFINCYELVCRAARYRAANRVDDYDQCMRALVRFFVDGDAAPARTPAQVRCAFRLPPPSTADAQAERRVLNAMRYLDGDAVRAACCGNVNVDDIDALKECAKYDCD